MSDEPLTSAEYELSKGSNNPILEFKVGHPTKRSLKALVDTGCTVGLLLSTDVARTLDLGDRINSDPTPILAADGHVLGADVYLSEIEIGGETHRLEVFVLDTSKILRSEPSTVTPLLGRALIDRFTVSFDGKAQRVSFFK